MDRTARILAFAIAMLVPCAVFAQSVSLADADLRTVEGQPWSLPDASESPLLVVVFLGTECPLARLYAPRLNELAAQFAPSRVAFLGVFSNLQDDVEKVRGYAADFSPVFPLVLDPTHHLADRLAAQRTPEAVVLDSARAIRYRGRIDDQYGIGYQRPNPRRHDLAQALDELIRGAAVSQASTEPVGCIIGRTPQVDAQPTVTWSSHIAGIFQRRCQTCHRPGEIGPFSLMNFDDAVGWAPTIAEVVSQGRMPPWHANPAHGEFANDARLSVDARQQIEAWALQGAPAGNLDETPPAHDFVVGWQLAEPDLIVEMNSSPFVVSATGVIDYQYFVADPGFTTDRWVRAAECRPGNRSVVHHVNVFVLPPEAQDDLSTDALSQRWSVQSEMLCGYVPGMRPKTYLPGMARLVPAGSKLVFQLHYTPTGKEEKDLSRVGLWFAEPDEIERQVRTIPAMNTWFEIPPHAADHPVEVWHLIKQDTLVLSFLPHMHLRGKSFRYTAHFPDGTSEILLDVPEYDFGWQNTYLLAQPRLLPAGSKLQCHATFDNSVDNPDNPNPEVAVHWGEQSWEEMMIGYFDVTLLDSPLPATATTRTSRWLGAGVLGGLLLLLAWGFGDVDSRPTAHHAS